MDIKERRPEEPKSPGEYSYSSMPKTAVMVRKNDYNDMKKRIESLESEIQKEKDRLRETAQILIEEIGADGPESAENTAARASGIISQQKSELAILEGMIETKNATLARVSKERDSMSQLKNVDRYVMEKTTWGELQTGDFICYRYDPESDDVDVWRRKDVGDE
jgi:hypothetical protein